MEKIVNRLINESLVNVDRYNNGGSTWLIFTETKQWVIELTKEGTLWYNYNYFKNLFNYLGVDVVENQHYITKWVEDTIQNGVKDTIEYDVASNPEVEDTIQNGVKVTNVSPTFTEYGDWLDGDERLDKIIQNGIKETYDDAYHHKSRVDGVIKNGIKQTCAQIPSIQPVVERILEEGILQTKPMDEWVNTNRIVDKVMTESIKETLWMNGDSTNWGLEDDDLLEGYDKIEDTINNGIKEVQPLPAQDGNRDWGNYYHGKEDRTKPFNEYLNDVIENGIKI